MCRYQGGCRCEECTRKHAEQGRRWYEANSGRLLAYERARRLKKIAADPSYLERQREKQRAWVKATGYKGRADPQKARAHSELQYAVRKGRVIRQPCEVCGAADSHGHHDDYSRPLEVRWLCPAHHGAQHRRFAEGEAA